MTTATYNSIMSYKREESKDRDPTDVEKFVGFFRDTLAQAYPNPNKDEMHPDIPKYLQQMYMMMVLNAKEFKQEIPIHDPKAAPVERSLVIPGYPNFLQVEASDNVTLCVLIRGTSRAPVRSEIVDLPEGKQVLVATHKLISALISISMVLTNAQAGQMPAFLAANIFRSCNIPECSPDLHNWGIHGHSGMNFVANYCYKKWMKAESKDGTGDKELADMGFPRVEILFFVASKLDESGDQRKNTLTGLGTGVTPELLETFKERINEADWEEVRSAKALAKLFCEEMKLLLLESSSGSNSKAGPVKKKRAPAGRK